MRREARYSEPDETDERRSTVDLDGPEPMPLLVERRADLSGVGIAFGAREAGREVRANLRVGVERGERSEIVVAPGAQDERPGSQHHRLCHVQSLVAGGGAHVAISSLPLPA